MKHRIILLCIAAGLISPAVAPGAAMANSASGTCLAVPVIGQETSTWSWAAASQMIMLYNGIPMEQCNEANHASGGHLPDHVNCCENPTSRDGGENDTSCAANGWPTFQSYGFKNFRSTDQGVALSWEQLTAEIDAGRPVFFSWLIGMTAIKSMVARGYKVSIDGAKMVYVNDPTKTPGTGSTYWMDYERYKTPGAGMSHYIDYYNLIKDEGTVCLDDNSEDHTALVNNARTESLADEQFERDIIMTKLDPGFSYAYDETCGKPHYSCDSNVDCGGTRFCSRWHWCWNYEDLCAHSTWLLPDEAALICPP